MAGMPVTLRLLDPPLHEFLPNAEDVAQELERARIERSDDLDEPETTLDRVHQLSEVNPKASSAHAASGCATTDA